MAAWRARPQQTKAGWHSRQRLAGRAIKPSCAITSPTCATSATERVGDDVGAASSAAATACGTDTCPLPVEGSLPTFGGAQGAMRTAGWGATSAAHNCDVKSHLGMLWKLGGMQVGTTYCTANETDTGHD
jgi:hypothetical protein